MTKIEHPFAVLRHRIDNLLTPEDFDQEEWAEPSRVWFLAWMGEDGWRYFLPGFVRLALLEPQKNLRLLLAHLDPGHLSRLLPT